VTPGRNMPRPRRRVGEEEEKTPVNEYYLRVSSRYRFSKYLFLLLAVLYLGVMLSLYGDSITYDNLRYLLKDLDTASDDISDGFADVTYEEQQGMAFALFRGELAVAGTSRLSLYLSGGSQGPEFNLNYDAPVLLSSDKYLLCYDLGDRQYSLYTTLANVRSAKTEHDITGGAMGKDGSFALITRSSTAKYQVTFWDSSFQESATYYKDRYVFDVAVSDDGEYLVILSADVSESVFNTEVMLCRKGESSPVATVMLEGVMPLRSDFFADGSFAVLTDSGVYFFDASGVETAFHPFTGLSLADFSGSYAVLVSSINVVGSENVLAVFDSRGEKLLEVSVSSRVEGLEAGSGKTFAYYLTPDTVCRLDSTGTVAEEGISGSALAILAAEDYALLCRAQKTDMVLKAQ